MRLVKNMAGSVAEASVCVPAAHVALVAAGVVVVLLAGLHVLSPEFDPSWRVVSEYANGRYGWVLSLMFASWALSSWALAVALWPQVKTAGGKVGLAVLAAAGVGEAMGAACDINHPLHNLAGMIGVLSLPVAAMLLSVRLGRTRAWAAARSTLLGTANLTWVSLLLLAPALVLISTGHARAARDTALIGWANRFLVVVYCVWAMTVAGQALRLRRRPAQ
jgi:hypothetical protein